MRFTSTLGSQLDQVVVPLTIWYQPGKLHQLQTSAHEFRIESDALDQQIYPLIAGKLRAFCQEAIHIKAGHLDRLDGVQQPGTTVSILGIAVLQLRNAPYTTHQKFRVVLYDFRTHHNFGYPHIGKTCLIAVLLLVEGHGDLVYHLIDP